MRGAEPSSLAGGGFGDGGAVGVPVPTLCPPGRRAVLHPASLVRHHPSSRAPGEQNKSCRDGHPLLYPALQYLCRAQIHLSPAVTPGLGLQDLSPPSPCDSKHRECGEAAALPGPGLCSAGQTAQAALGDVSPG